ncbi:hypothetical protein TIFTF001_047305 [Ficus carica]|uniref:H(+)-transporting two-sector ATPase n=1 Tax=Ficus carica TaxID=3494 RepID=A0AA87ZBL0_FICCA|nr:hypothetical protein TIFTF001_047305 [Ficus carica]
METKESGIINEENIAESKVALVYGQMNEPPGARMRVRLTALTMAEYFRDVNEQDVLPFIDNIFRFVYAGSEVSALLGRMPSVVGYQPTLSTDMGSLQERITSTKEGSITSIEAVSVPADDLTDSVPATTVAHLHATTVLSSGLAAKSIYPAVDPLDSTSTMLQPRIVGEEHYETAQRVKQTLQRYKELQDIIAIIGLDEPSEDDHLIVAGAQKVERRSKWDETYLDPILVPIGPVSRARVKKFKDALMGLIRATWSQAIAWRPIEGITSDDQPNKCVIQVLEETE